jgi:hypothetical protein
VAKGADSGTEAGTFLFLAPFQHKGEKNKASRQSPSLVVMHEQQQEQERRSELTYGAFRQGALTNFERNFFLKLVS